MATIWYSLYMNYIGSKKSLLKFIRENIAKHVETPGIFCDAFTGTGAVAADFKAYSWQVIAGDIQEYSVVRLQHLLLNNEEPSFKKLLSEDFPDAETPGERVLLYLDRLPGMKGFVYNNYSSGGTAGEEYVRNYFTDSNAMRCDAIRECIETWDLAGLLSEGERAYLLASLLESVDQRANTASVYGAFLKSTKASAAKDLELKPLSIIPGNKKNVVEKRDANDLVASTSGDVLYLDPPYNRRQYASNYHLLETIALNDSPMIKGKTGLRDWKQQKSPWCSHKTVLPAFEEIIEKADYSLIALSYNDEGIMSLEEVEKIMKAHGKYTLYTKKYSRFRADRAEARNHKKDFVYEYLHVLEKD